MDSKKRIKGWRETDKRLFAYQGDKKRSTAQETIIHKPSDQTDALSAAHIPKVLSVSEPANLTSMLEESMPGTSDTNPNGETQQQLTLPDFPTLTSSVRDSLANLSALLERDMASPTQEELSSLRLLESVTSNDLAIFSLRTSKDFSPSTTGLPSRPSSQRFLRLGMTVNGKCLTARISESRRIGKECSLSDILETSPDPKYFLSEKMAKHLLEMQTEAHPMQLIQITGKDAILQEGQIQER